MLRQTQPRPRMDCAGRAVLAALILQRIRTSNMKDQVKTDDRALAPPTRVKTGIGDRCSPGLPARRSWRFDSLEAPPKSYGTVQPRLRSAPAPRRRMPAQPAADRPGVRRGL
jgi:hypothetical protein